MSDLITVIYGKLLDQERSTIDTLRARVAELEGKALEIRKLWLDRIRTLEIQLMALQASDKALREALREARLAINCGDGQAAIRIIDAALAHDGGKGTG